jgi:putative tryptophan/tyrosine transport system substrate-binding protein
MIGGGTWEGAPMFDMRRREFITLLGGAAVGWPLAARAQQTTMPVIGFLNGASPGEWTRFLTAFRGGLRESGFTEGQNVAIEFRWAEGRYDRLPALAADLVNRRVAVLVATAGTTTAVAAKAATSTIPTVFSTGGDPVKEGLVASISRPGGNRTGVSVLTTALAPKRLEILREVVPKASVIGVLLNPNNASTQPQLEDVEKAARVIDQQVRILRASSERDFEPAFATMAQTRIGALIVGADPFFGSRRDQLVALAARNRIPAIYEWREFAEAGGLMSYGSDLADGYRQVGIYTGRILRGDKPADLPVVQSTKIEFVLNLKTARSLGLTISLPLLGRADEVIE